MGASGTMLQGAGAIIGAMGAGRQAQAQKDALNTQAQLDANNAKIAGWQANQALSQGAVEEGNSRLQTASVYGEQRAQLSANGVDLGVGNATDILSTTQFMGNRDALTIRDNAARTAWGYRTQGTNYQNQEAIARNGAAGINVGMAEFSTLLGNAGEVDKSWQRYQMGTQNTPSAVNYSMSPNGVQGSAGFQGPPSWAQRSFG